MVKTQFYDRKGEMGLLNRAYDEMNRSGNGSMLAIYGRRRVGKTEIVRMFLEGKPKTLYFYVDLAERSVILSALSSAVQEQLKENVSFSDFGSFFAYIKEHSAKRTFIVAIDEFQRFMEVAPEFITSLQKHWDISFKQQKVMILLVGSSIGMIQKITGSKAGALYGRATKVKVSPFRYQDFRHMFKELSEEEKILRYAVFGGTPYYLEKTKRFADTMTAVNELLIKKGGELSEEPKNLLEYENVRIHAKYNSILQSISSGKEVLKEIQDFTKIPSTTLPPYIDKLDALLDLVEKNDPLLGKERLRRYRIKDNFFRFWYRFIFENQTALHLGNTELVFGHITENISSYTGRIFEMVVKELLISYNRKELDGNYLNFENIGSWWDRNGNEIDILAYNTKEGTYLVGEVKWSSKAVNADEVDTLIRKTKLLHRGGKYTLLLVSKSGFTEQCIIKMQENRVLHLDLKDIARLFNALGSG